MIDAHVKLAASLEIWLTVHSPIGAVARCHDLWFSVAFTWDGGLAGGQGLLTPGHATRVRGGTLDQRNNRFSKSSSKARA
jgi:hypothetical protein